MKNKQYYYLLFVIYAAFISLVLPDSLLGSAWPSMYQNLSVPLSYMGYIQMLICGGTVISSAMSGKIITKARTSVITAVSTGLTAIALFGFSMSDSYFQLCLWSIPYGLGAGCIDSVLNNYIALHYKSRHMSWLHCFWGVGATIGPYIMSLCLAHGESWNQGYRTIGMIQLVMLVFLFLTIPLWKINTNSTEEKSEQKSSKSISEVLNIKGVKLVLLAFFCYCSLENISGCWAGSYMVVYKGIDAQTAAKWSALFYLGITGGRFLSGVVSDTFGDRNMVRIGQLIGIVGIIMMLLPGGLTLTLIGLLLIGMGCAPIYPSLLHETPENFGAENSQSIIGIQMAMAYIGSTFMPPFFGLIAEKFSISLYPFFLLFFLGAMFLIVESLNRYLHPNH